MIATARRSTPLVARAPETPRPTETAATTTPAATTATAAAAATTPTPAANAATEHAATAHAATAHAAAEHAATTTPAATAHVAAEHAATAHVATTTPAATAHVATTTPAATPAAATAATATAEPASKVRRRTRRGRGRRRAIPTTSRRSAGSVGWWGVSLILASLGVVVLIGAVTFERVGRREIAVPALTAALQQPTERLLVRELARPDGGPRVAADDDLVAFDVDRAEAMADPQTVARRAAEQRAAALYDGNLPADPGPSRTEIGISRSFVGVMSEQNHDKVAGTRIAAAIFAAALLLWCLVQARNDNVLLLPACALAGGWVLASAAKLLVVTMLSGVNGASATYVRSVEAAALQPLALAKTAAIGMLAGAALYRLITLARLRLAHRAARRTAQVARTARATGATVLAG